MADERSTMTCPDCGAPVAPARERLCPRCGFPLMFLKPEVEPAARVVARAPGERDEATVAAPPVGPVPRVAPPPPAEQLVCPQCAHPNPASRVRCERCGRQLRAIEPAPLPPPPPPAPPVARRRGYLVPVLAAVAVLGAAAGVGVWLGTRTMPSPGAPPASPQIVLTPVDRAAVTATASSTVPGSPLYVVANTLDGDPTTAWHSDGKRLPNNVGVRVTYRFQAPVRLGRITLVNGFARSPTDYTNNERIARTRVEVAGSAALTWELKDTSDPQVLTLDPKPTEAVTFVIEAIYPGTKFKDLTITEVSFDAVR